MRTTMRTLVALAAGVVVMLALTATAAADHPGGGGTPFTVMLVGAEECNAQGVCGLGDLDGSGVAKLTLNQGQGEVCYTITVGDVQTITAAHIHRAPAGVSGPIVVPLNPTGDDAADGQWSGCTEVDKELVKAIRQNPAGYYVNVHNPPFPAGALRGQLG